MVNIIYADESYEIVGACMAVHNALGPGLLEIIYKEALEIEFQERGIFYEREKGYPVFYKGFRLPKSFYADFVVMTKIILEAKSKAEFSDNDIAWAINYGKLSGCRLVLLVNFGKAKLDIKRILIEG